MLDYAVMDTINAPEEYVEEFKDYLARVMREEHINQTQLAADSGVGQSSIAHMLNPGSRFVLVRGKNGSKKKIKKQDIRIPNEATCRKLAEALHRPAEEVLLAAGRIKQPPERDEFIERADHYLHSIANPLLREAALHTLKAFSEQQASMNQDAETITQEAGYVEASGNHRTAKSEPAN